MTETLVGVSPPSPSQEPSQGPRPPSAEELAAAHELVKGARDRCVALTGPDGLLKALTKTVVETALDEEMAEHLGHDKHAVEGCKPGELPERGKPKTIVTEAAGEVQIEVPLRGDGRAAGDGLGAGGVGLRGGLAVEARLARSASRPRPRSGGGRRLKVHVGSAHGVRAVHVTRVRAAYATRLGRPSRVGGLARGASGQVMGPAEVSGLPAWTWEGCWTAPVCCGCVLA